MSGHIYLAGPITGLTYDEGQDWRIKAEGQFAQFGFKSRSPLRGKAYLRSEGVLHPQRYEHLHPLSSDRGIVARDRNDTITAALVFANLSNAPRASTGTCIELGWADIARVPTVVVMGPDNPNDSHMVRGVADYIMCDYDAAIDLALTILGVDLHVQVNDR